MYYLYLFVLLISCIRLNFGLSLNNIINIKRHYENLMKKKNKMYLGETATHF